MKLQLIILLGFGLKYQDLNEKEQKKAVGLLKSELEHNLFIVSELKKNTDTFSNAVNIVSSILRKKDFKINSGLFSPSNIDPNTKQDPDLYNKNMNWLKESGLLDDQNIVRRFREQNAAIVRTVNRTKSTLQSLGDQKAKRYVIERKAFDSNLNILRKIHIVNVTDLSNLYSKTSEVREKYYRISSITNEYLDAINEFCSQSKPDHTALGAALATERLTARILPEYVKELNEIIDKINNKTNQFSLSLNI